MLFNTAQSLEDYIRKYQPDCWCETIESVAFVPFYTDKEYAEMQTGVFPDKTPWYIKQAVNSFFLILKEQNK